MLKKNKKKQKIQKVDSFCRYNINIKDETSFSDEIFNTISLHFIQDTHGRHDRGDKSHSLWELPTTEVDGKETSHISFTSQFYRWSCCQCLNWCDTTRNKTIRYNAGDRKNSFVKSNKFNFFSRASCWYIWKGLVRIILNNFLNKTYYGPLA